MEGDKFMERCEFAINWQEGMGCLPKGVMSDVEEMREYRLGSGWKGIRLSKYGIL